MWETNMEQQSRQLCDGCSQQSALFDRLILFCFVLCFSLGDLVLKCFQRCETNESVLSQTVNSHLSFLIETLCVRHWYKMNKGVYHCHPLGFFLLVLCLWCQEGDSSNFWWPDVCAVPMCVLC